VAKTNLSPRAPSPRIAVRSSCSTKKKIPKFVHHAGGSRQTRPQATAAAIQARDSRDKRRFPRTMHSRAPRRERAREAAPKNRKNNNKNNKNNKNSTERLKTGVVPTPGPSSTSRWRKKRAQFLQKREPAATAVGRSTTQPFSAPHCRAAVYAAGTSKDGAFITSHGMFFARSR